MSAPRRHARRALTAALWAGLGLVTGLLLAIAAPLAFGGRPSTVLSGSMEPAVGKGDVVVGWPVSPLETRPGDVITFSDPTRRDRLVTHRLVSRHVVGARSLMVTRGDANDAPERWSVANDAELSRVAYHVPEVGRLTAAAQRAPSRAAIVAAPIFLLVMYELAGLLRRLRAEPRAPA